MPQGVQLRGKVKVNQPTDKRDSDKRDKVGVEKERTEYYIVILESPTAGNTLWAVLMPPVERGRVNP